MSLWIRTRDKDGTVHYGTVPFDPVAPIALTAMSVALLLPFLHMFRESVVSTPVTTFVLCAGILTLGLALFSVAKYSVIRTGRLISFGPRAMSRTMRCCYFAGHVFLAIGTIAILLYASAASMAA